VARGNGKCAVLGVAGRRSYLPPDVVEQLKGKGSFQDELKSSALKKDARAAMTAAINAQRGGASNDVGGSGEDEDEDYIDKPMIPKPDNKTVAKYLDMVLPEEVRNADQQSERRRETMANPRTHISAAVVIPQSQKGVGSALKFSTDRWTKTATPSADKRHGKDNVLRLAEGSKAKLAARNLQPAHTPRGKEAVTNTHVHVHVDGTFAADGTWFPPMLWCKAAEGDNISKEQLYLVCVALYLCIDTLLKFSLFFQLKTRKSAERWNHDAFLYLAPGGPGSEARATYVLWKYVVLPAIERRRTEIDAARQRPSQSSQEDAPNEPSRSWSSCDGCGQSANLPMVILADQEAHFSGPNVLVKLDACKTEVRQPADVGKQHAEGHRYELQDKLVMPDYMGPTKRFSNKLDADATPISMSAILGQYSENRSPWVERTLRNLRPMLYYINDPKFTVQGWRLSGLDDGNGHADQHIILSAWPGYSRAGKDVRRHILSSMPALDAYCDEHGRISNEEMTRLGLPDIRKEDKIVRSRKQPDFDERPLQQDWCVILNHAATKEREATRKRIREEGAEALEARKHQKLEQRAADDAANKPIKKVRHANAACAHLNCPSQYPGPGKEGQKWVFCSKRKCTALFCNAEACALARTSHEATCVRT
jgi:hypothetical protein